MLIARTPRVKCPEHGVKNAAVPWAEKGSRFTLMFERFAIDVLLAAQTVKGAQSILGTSWDETWHILTKAVQRGKARKTDKAMPRIGIDEKAFRKGQNYITLIYDLDRSTVEAISDGNDTDSGNACFSQLSQAQRDSVEAISMDMSVAFVKATKANIPMAETKIVHDRFHIMKLATEAVDKVRRGEHRRLTAQGDVRLSGTRYHWLTSQENLNDRQKERFEAASAYKEMLRDLWHHADAQSARELQDSDLLLLRRAQPLPTINPDGPFYRLLGNAKPLSEAYDVARATSQSPLVLLMKKDLRFVAKRKKSRRSA